MKNILFLCVSNASRSQIAEGLARQMLADKAHVFSAGSEPSAVHPMAITVMSEAGIDISEHKSKSLNDLQGIDDVDIVITLCADEVCPIMPGTTKRLHWPLPDPSRVVDDDTATQLHERFVTVRDQIRQRIAVLGDLLDVSTGPDSEEFHGSIRVTDLPRSTAFYAWLLNTWPKEWTHRYATFSRSDLKLNFVLLVADDHTLHHDTLYHLGIGVANRQSVIDTYHLALSAGAHVEKPPRTTWRGTPLHELWLKDPDGTLIEVYARLTDTELAQMPEDQEPWFLVPGT